MLVPVLEWGNGQWGDLLGTWAVNFKGAVDSRSQSPS